MYSLLYNGDLSSKTVLAKLCLHNYLHLLHQIPLEPNWNCTTFLLKNCVCTGRSRRLRKQTHWNPIRLICEIVKASNISLDRRNIIKNHATSVGIITTIFRRAFSMVLFRWSFSLLCHAHCLFFCSCVASFISIWMLARVSKKNFSLAEEDSWVV